MSPRWASTVSPSSTATLSAPGTKARITIPPGQSCGPRTAKASPCRAATMAATSSLDACTPPLMAPSPGRAHRHVPDVLGILRDRAIGRKPADPGSVQDSRSPPCLGIAPPRVHRPLCRIVCIEIGRDQKMIVVTHGIDKTLETTGLTGREHARSHLLERLLKCGRGGDDIAHVDALAAPGIHLVRREPEDEDILRTDMLEDFHIGPVERADRQCSVERQLHVAGARRLHARRRDLLGKVSRGNDGL